MIHRLGVVSAIDKTTGLSTVTVDGTDIIAATLGQMPVVGWSVWVEKRGLHGQDWVVTGIASPVASGYQTLFSRYTFGRTSLGITSGSTVQIGTPPTTPWSTGSNTTTDSTITITQDCHLDLTVTCSGQGVFLLTTTGAAVGFYTGGVTQGGGVYREVLNYSGLLLDGETLTINIRNTAAGLVDYVFKTLMTFCDAYAVVAQT